MGPGDMLSRAWDVWENLHLVLVRALGRAQILDSSPRLTYQRKYLFPSCAAISFWRIVSLCMITGAGSVIVEKLVSFLVFPYWLSTKRLKTDFFHRFWFSAIPSN